MSQLAEISAPPEADKVNRLEHFPVTFFAVVMGLCGLALATHAASGAVPAAGPASQLILLVAVTAFATIAGVYATKAIRFPRAVRAEWHHPVKLAFFPTISISLLLISTALYSYLPDLARPVWTLGAVMQGGLTLAVLTGWISHRSFALGHLTPAWFIPAVGNVIVPVAGAQMGYVEISWLFFSGGLVFWIVLLTLVFNRMIFHEPIPARLFPTLVILIAPPALAFVAYFNLTGQLDSFARILLNAAYVFALLIALQFPALLRLPFALSWWALSFPVAALAIASFLYARVAESMGHQIIGFIVLGVLAAIIAGLVYRTAVAVVRNEICRPD